MISLGIVAAATPRAAGGGASDVKWDSAHKSTPAVLSSGDLRLAANTGVAGTYANARSTKAIQGLCYLSFRVGAPAGGATNAAGIADAVLDFTNASNWAGQVNGSVGAYLASGAIYKGGSVVGNLGALGTDSELQFAIRVASRRVWIRKPGGAWIGGGDPAADTTPTTTLGGTGDLYAVGTITRLGATSGHFCDLHPDAGSTTGDVPSGFTAAGFAP